MFEAEKFCKDYNISFDVTGKNTAPGWTQLQCPFCGDSHNHLGINKVKEYANCWKCNWHSLNDTIAAILGISQYEAKSIIKLYISNAARNHLQKKEIITAEKVVLPTGTTELKQMHKDYLIKRKFDPEKLVSSFNLKGTGHMGPYKFRIVAPIYLEGNLISYQCRDITGKATLRYKACAKENEVLHHKHTLYAIDKAVSIGKKVVVVEGITDVFRLGQGAVCPFGTSWTKKQRIMLTKYFETIFILFDEGDEAQERAHNLSWELSAMGVKVEIIEGLEGDPGEMDQIEANKLMHDLFKGE